MSAAASILLFLSALVTGVILCPVVIFLRARKDRHWDDSNMTNIIRVLAHLATHPGDFAKFRYPDGRRPFWYLDKDELSDVVDTRPWPAEDHDDAVEITLLMQSLELANGVLSRTADKDPAARQWINDEWRPALARNGFPPTRGGPFCPTRKPDEERRECRCDAKAESSVLKCMELSCGKILQVGSCYFDVDGDPFCDRNCYLTYRNKLFREFGN